MAAFRKHCEDFQDVDPLRQFPAACTLLDEVHTIDLDHLLGAAIDRFRYSGRDVYQAAFKFKFSDLEDAIRSSVSPSVFHWVLIPSPVYTGAYTNDKWNVDLKSRSPKAQKLGITGQTAIRQKIDKIH